MINISDIESKSFSIFSKAFKNNGYIPDKYTCKGKNILPELYWKNAPKDTKSFALIIDDPDAPQKTWVHFIIFNIDKSIDRLSEDFLNSSDYQKNKDKIKLGKNDFGKNNYGGPCPPAGKIHRYFFKLYALDKFLDLESGVSKENLLIAIKNHILAQAELIGLYKIENN